MYALQCIPEFPMASTFTSLLYHVVFSTKERRPLITPELEPELHKYIGGILRQQGAQLLDAGGVSDHVHLAVRMPANQSVADILRLIKANSSKWVNELPDRKSRFAWQRGYGAFTVSRSQCPAVRRYILLQKQHHQAKTFQQEFLEILRRHEIEFDERYLWD